jgi:hypothetical protein
LGPFEFPTTEHLAKLFSNVGMVILDPLQPNVSATLADVCENFGAPSHIAGRLDLGVLLKHLTYAHGLEAFLVSSLDKIMSTVLTHFRALDGDSNGFNGILVAGWEILPVPSLHQLSAALSSTGLDVYLEISAPDFLKDSTVLGAESIAGIVVRNGLLHRNGDRRDYFDMESLSTTVKAFVSHTCQRNFTTLMWETLDDDTVPSTDVLTRTYNWCSFYSAVPWIGPRSALFDASIEVIKFQPLSAFDWLKDHHVMELHDLWRNNRTVSYLQFVVVRVVLSILTITNVFVGRTLNSKSLESK